MGLLALLAVLAGCDSLTGSSARDEALVELTPLGGAEAVSLVTSTSFGVAGAQVLLVESDTQVVGVPNTDVYSLGEDKRFYVSVGPEFEGDTATVRMEVWIDGQSWFSETRTLGIDSVGTMTFVYRFRQPTL